jgi:hypothetical protein
MPGVVGKQDSLQTGGALRQGRQEKGTVCDALGTGHGDDQRALGRKTLPVYLFIYSRNFKTGIC